MGIGVHGQGDGDFVIATAGRRLPHGWRRDSRIDGEFQHEEERAEQGESDRMQQEILQQVTELDHIRKKPKCAQCECLLDVLAEVGADLTARDEAEYAELGRVVTEWQIAGNSQRHACLGCEDCLPIGPYNRLSALLHPAADRAVPEAQPAPPCASCAGSCDASGVNPPAQSENWPLVPGDYRVGDPRQGIAVCTLADTDLSDELTASDCFARVAIVGSLATENLGIERMIRNVVANPQIRVLVLCGRDSRGHQAGQAILALKANGVGADRRIIGAKGPRPVLKNITGTEIKAFQANISVIDAIGVVGIEQLSEMIRRCQLEGPVVTLAPAPPAITLPKTIRVIQGEQQPWVADPEGFFVILLDTAAGVIRCEHYTADGSMNEVLDGTGAEEMALTAIRRGLVSRLDHAAYLGRELAKAEQALRGGCSYRQDAG